MGMLGKIFGVLVLLLSIAVAVLSWMLADQRKMFRGHSEALAQGIVQVAKQVGSSAGVDVSAEISQVTYTKAPEGGREAGVLGFEDYRKNPQSVSTGINSLLSALQKRQEQTEAMALTLADSGKIIGVDGAAGINKDSLLTDADYLRKYNTIKGRVQLVVARDEALRSQLAATSEQFGVSTDELSYDRFAKSERAADARGGFTVNNLFNEFDISLELLKQEQSLFASTLTQFRDTVDSFDRWSFEDSGLRAATKRFATTSKSSTADGQDARKRYIADMKAKLDAFVADARNLNNYIAEMKKDMRRLTEQAANLKETAERVQAQKDELSRKLTDIKAINKKLRAENDWAIKNLNELKQANRLNAIPEDPLKAPVLKELKEIKPEFTSDISRVEKKHNFVIISANNRQLCPGAKLIVIRRNDDNEIEPAVRLEVRECTDLLSTAYVIAGDISDIKLGDRVELSVEHDDLVKQAEDAKAAAVKAKLRAAREVEERRAREAIERRREAEKQSNADDLMGF